MESGHGKVMEHEKLAQSQKFGISHGILPILPLNCTIFVWKIKKWSWKSHGKIFCQVCGNPVNYFKSMYTYMYLNSVT